MQSALVRNTYVTKESVEVAYKEMPRTALPFTVVTYMYDVVPRAS